MKSKFLLLLALLMASNLAWAYRVNTHRKFNTRAVEASQMLKTRLPELGYVDSNALITDNLMDWAADVCICNWRPSYPAPIKEVIARGGVCEDSTLGGADPARYFHHFYDPVHGGHGYTFEQWFNPFTLSTPWASSLTWGLEPTDQGGQDYSYKDAKDYLYKGMTSTAQSERQDNMRLMFRALGMVMHLVDDAAQPQHTRDDPHGDGSFYEIYTDYYSGLSGIINSSGNQSFQVDTPDQFWEDNRTSTSWGLAEFSNYNFVTKGTNFVMDVASGVPVVPASAVSNGLLFPLPTPGNVDSVVPVEQLTSTAISTGTGFLWGTANAILPLPTWAQPPKPDATTQTIAPSIVDYCNQWPAGTCSMTFYETAGWNLTLGYGTSYSIFDEDIRNYQVPTAVTSSGTTYINRLFTLNHYNFDTAFIPVLAPLAVDYATSVLDYFFRGKIEIGLPKEHVYGVVDMTQKTGSQDGFNTIRLNVNNTTLNGTVKEDMSGGSFVVVARYHVNPCYTSDLMHEPYWDPSWNAQWPCGTESRYEQVSVSNPVTLLDGTTLLTGLKNGTPQDVQAHFVTAIPLSATSLYLQVVFKGTLGKENNSIAFGGKDIAEPMFQSFVNNSDQLCVDGTWYDTTLDPTLVDKITNAPPSSPARLAIEGLKLNPDQMIGIQQTPIDVYFGFNNIPQYSSGIAGLPAGAFSRIAVLADNANWPISIASYGSYNPSLGASLDYNFAGMWSVWSAEAQTDPKTGIFWATPVAQYRQNSGSGFRSHIAWLPQMDVTAKTCDVYKLGPLKRATPFPVTTIQSPFN